MKDIKDFPNYDIQLDYVNRRGIYKDLYKVDSLDKRLTIVHDTMARLPIPTQLCDRYGCGMYPSRHL
jgi:hypothetical protein